MEGLGVAASIVGLLAAASKMVPWLYEVWNGVRDAPDSIKAVWAELRETTSILQQLQQYILQIQPTTSNQRSLILLEDIAVTLTGCVITYSDLEQNADFSKDSTDVFDRGKWLLKEKEILDAVRRLQNHKSSLILMLNILQCHSIQEAKETMQKLCGLLQNTVLQDTHLMTQLKRHGDTNDPSMLPIPDANSISDFSYIPNMSNNTPTITSTSFRGTIARLSNRVASLRFSSSQKYIFSFERELKSSWVYQRSGKRGSKSSTLSRVGSERGISLSALSKISLAEISNISVFSLPILEIDIYNSEWYQFPRGKLDPRTHSRGSHNLPVPEFIDVNFPTVGELVGREDILEDIAANLIKARVSDAGNDTAIENMETFIYVLWGSPGCGKTQIALEFARRKHLECIENRKAHGRFLWVDAGTEDSIIRHFSQFAKEFKISKASISDPESSLSDALLLLDWLGIVDLPWLIVFDGVTQMESVYKWLPDNPQGIVLVTTRNPTICGETLTSLGREVPPLSRSDAIKMLRKCLPLPYGDKTALELVTKVQFLPVGIKAVSALIKKENLALVDWDWVMESPKWGTTVAILRNCTIGQAYSGPNKYLDDTKPLHSIWDDELEEVIGTVEEDSKEAFGMNLITFLYSEEVPLSIFSIRDCRPYLSGLDKIYHKTDPTFLENISSLVVCHKEAGKPNIYRIDRLTQYSNAIRMSEETRYRFFDCACCMVIDMLFLWVRCAQRNLKEPIVRSTHTLQQFFWDFFIGDGFKTFGVPLKFLTVLRFSLQFFRVFDDSHEDQDIINKTLGIQRTLQAIVLHPRCKSRIYGHQDSLYKELADCHYMLAAKTLADGNLALSISHLLYSGLCFENLENIQFKRSKIGPYPTLSEAFDEALHHKWLEKYSPFVDDLQQLSFYKVIIIKCIFNREAREDAFSHLDDIMTMFLFSQKYKYRRALKSSFSGHPSKSSPIYDNATREYFDRNFKELHDFASHCAPQKTLDHEEVDYRKCGQFWTCLETLEYLMIEQLRDTFRATVEVLRNIAGLRYWISLQYAVLGEKDEAALWRSKAEELRKEAAPETLAETWVQSESEIYRSLATGWGPFWDIKLPKYEMHPPPSGPVPDIPSTSSAEAIAS